MNCGRLAMLMLITGILLCAPTRGSQSSGAPAGKTLTLITEHTGSSVDSIIVSRPYRGATCSQFIPWRRRLKTILEETNEKVVEECDLGPAIPPDRFINSAPIQLASCPLATPPPLRC
jgi:hypothetical protein